MRGGAPSISMQVRHKPTFFGSIALGSVVDALNPVSKGTLLRKQIEQRKQAKADRELRELSARYDLVERREDAIHNSLAPLLTKLKEEKENVEKLQKTIGSLSTSSSLRPSARRERMLKANIDDLRQSSVNVGRLQSAVNSTLQSIILAEKAQKEVELRKKGTVGTKRSSQSTNLQNVIRKGLNLSDIGLETKGGVKRRVYKGVKKPVKRPVKRPAKRPVRK